MTDFINHRSIRRSVLFLMLLNWITSACITFVGCSGGGGTNDGDNSRGTELKVQLEWQSQISESETGPAPSNLDACFDFQITGIYIRVKNASGQIVTKSEVMPCTDHSAVLRSISAQTGCTVEVDGYVGDQILWFGSKENVSVIDEKNTDPVVVEMNYIGAAAAPPSATTSPVDSATNVPTDSTITVSFDKAVVPASVNTHSIMVSNGSGPLPGIVTYNADTFEALFKPDQELAVSTRYTVTVTTDVLDFGGRRLPQQIVSHFSTPTVWYVDPTSDISGPGKTWGEAFHTITEAVAAAGRGDQIWISQGTYKPKSQIAIDKPMELLGGFEGSETHKHQRDWSVFKTIVDGNGENRCFYLSSEAVIDGFIITGGSQDKETMGGAVYVDGGETRISNCLFVDNSELENILQNTGGSLTVNSCVFKNNNLLLSSIKINSYNPTTITDCRFENNITSGSGAAIVALNSRDISIKGCFFANNTSNEAGGAIYFWYGQNINIENSVFNANRVIGGEKFGFGGAIAFEGRPEALIKNCTFAYNEVVDADDTFGGAICNRGDLTMINSILWGNKAKSWPQYYNDDEPAKFSISNSYISENRYSNENHIITDDPRFGPDLHLRADSPCLDEADSSAAPAMDMDGENRTQEPLPDIGADEFVDSDGDRMPDYWEALHGVSIAGGDEDGDNVPNLSEYNLGTDPNKAQLVIDATIRGAIRDDGFHQASDYSTPVGGIGSQSYRSFFIFNVAESPPVKTAALRLELVDFMTGSARVDLFVWDVATDADAISADTNGQAGLEIYDDLGTGTQYAFYETNPTEKASVLDIQLNRDTVDAINSASKGSGQFVIGVTRHPKITADKGHLLFSTTDEIRTHQLVLTTD